eukprot:gene20400-40162_t
MKALRSIETSFRAMRLVSIVSIIGMVISVIGGFMFYNIAINQSSNQIYIMSDNGSIALARKSSVSSEREIETKDHILAFHERLYNLDNNEEQISYTLNKASYLGDTKQILASYKEINYYNNLIQRNFIQRVYKDSIKLSDNFSQGIFYGHLIINGSNTRGTKALQTQFNVTKGLDRVESNPHGLFITNIRVIKEDLVTTINH